MTITTINELLTFLNSSWDKLSNEHYCEILQKTLGVYEFDKPKNKELAIMLIENHYTKIKNSNSELPLFLEYENI
jgi:uncharacterized protein YihD (DUF1040 family)